MKGALSGLVKLLVPKKQKLNLRITCPVAFEGQNESEMI